MQSSLHILPPDGTFFAWPLAYLYLTPIESIRFYILHNKLLKFTYKLPYYSKVYTMYLLHFLINISHRYRLMPRVLRDVSSLDMTTHLLGEEVAFPICLAPTAMQQMAHYDGELATARGMTSISTNCQYAYNL